MNPETRPMYWSVWRELWENRALYFAPLLVSAVELFGFAISTIGMPQRRRAVLLLDPDQQRAAVARPYDLVAVMLVATALIVGVFYCLDALYGERRDRSVLFWKSLPVSDLTTVLSKASVPLMILPAIIFAVIVATQLVMLFWSSVILLPSGLSATTWSRYNLFEHSLLQLYSFVVLSLWHAPIYGWLLLISAWARRAAFLWAALPLLAIGVLEKIAFNTTYFVAFLKYRFIGHVATAFTLKANGRLDSFSQLTPGNFFSTPGLWIGLLFTAVFLAAAVRLRRYREPI